MDVYDQCLQKLVSSMMDERGCTVESRMLLESIVDLLRNRIKDIAILTSNGAAHAGRTKPCYFDVERTFCILNITADDLSAVRDANRESQPCLRLQKKPMRQEDFFKGPQLMLGAGMQRARGAHAYIPPHLPPFPSAHSYRNTLIDKEVDKSYASVRSRHADNQLDIRKALNGFYVRTQPTISLFEDGETYERREQNELGLVLTGQPVEQPAYLRALMPQNQVFDFDVYECNDEITHGKLLSPFLTITRQQPNEQEQCDEKPYIKQEQQEMINWSLPD